MKKIISINLKNNKYNILLSQFDKDFLTAFKKIQKTTSLFIVTDKIVEKLYLQKFSDLLEQQDFNIKTAVIPAGESGKSIKNLSFLYNKALESSINRKSCAIALGGGVIGDITGFFAATYMREDIRLTCQSVAEE